MSLACDDGGSAPDDVPSQDLAEPSQDTGEPPGDSRTPPVDVLPDLQDSLPCLALPFDGIVPIDLWGPDTQIHGAAAFDGEGIWIAYNRQDVDGGSGFDVFATRIGCDGAVLVEPFAVNEVVQFNETDPAISVSGDTIMIAWQSDSGQAPTNLSVWFRSYFIDGTPRMDHDVVLEFDPTSFTIDPNAWMPALTGTDGGFALAAAAAPEGYDVFQTWLQRLDLDGNPTAIGLHILPDPLHSQTFPSIGRSGDDGRLIATWERTPLGGDTTVEFVRIDASGAVGEAVLPSNGEPSFGPNVSSGYPDAADNALRVTFGVEVEGDRYVVLHAPYPQAPLMIVDADGVLDYGSVVAHGAIYGAVAWFRNLGGLKHDLLLRVFEDPGAGVPVFNAPPVPINPVPAAPYQPGLVALPGGFFVVWSDGDNPSYRLKGKFIRVAGARR